MIWIKSYFYYEKIIIILKLYKNLGFEIEGKNVFQACSNSDNTIPIIAESPVFDDFETLFSYGN